MVLLFLIMGIQGNGGQTHPYILQVSRNPFVPSLLLFCPPTLPLLSQPRESLITSFISVAVPTICPSRWKFACMTATSALRSQSTETWACACATSWGRTSCSHWLCLVGVGGLSSPFSRGHTIPFSWITPSLSSSLSWFVGGASPAKALLGTVASVAKSTLKPTLAIFLPLESVVLNNTSIYFPWVWICRFQATLVKTMFWAVEREAKQGICNAANLLSDLAAGRQ